MLTLILQISICILIAVVYTTIGYNITNLLTDSPKWTKIEQIMLWVLWPFLLFAVAVLVFGLMLFAIILAIVLLIAFIYDTCKGLINKYFRK